MSEREETAGGTLGKLAGRAKALAGAPLGREDLHREGRLQQVQSEAERDAAELADKAARKDEEAELAKEKAETEAERRQVELEANKIEAEEQAERKLARERQEAERVAGAEVTAAERERRAEEARAEGTKREAVGEQAKKRGLAGELKREARRAEEAADAIDPKEEN